MLMPAKLPGQLLLTLTWAAHVPDALAEPCRQARVALQGNLHVVRLIFTSF